MWWWISIGARPMPSVVFSLPASSSCMARKRSGTILSLPKRSASTCCARQRSVPFKRSSYNGQRQPTVRKQRSQMSSHGSRAVFKDSGRIVIVGASLAGLSAAETLRAEGFRGPLTLIGDEPYLPYDRPPLSKAVLTGWVPAEHTQLPRRETLADVEWRLGVAGGGLDLPAKEVRVADGHSVAAHHLLIATGTRAPPSPNQPEAELAVARLAVGWAAESLAFDINAFVTDDVFVAGAVALFPQPLYDSQFLSLKHWGNGVEQATIAAHNMVWAPAARRPHVAVPA